MQKIFQGNTLSAIHITRLVRGVTPVTSPSDALQLLTHNRLAGETVRPHRHLRKKRSTTMLQEGLIVISGKIRIDLYTAKKKCFKKIFVKAGEAALLFGIPHAVHFIENSLLYEVKNGPFIADRVDL